uniref:Uncharacterized protein n=1 Tax=Panagrolaimus sp. JU765 TaxID=591449 RepID=A0AC34R6P3_9BILA
MAVDYSRCSITKKFMFYLYELDKNEKDYVALNFQNELSNNQARTLDDKFACLFIGIVTKSFNPQNYQFFNDVGRNHVFLVLNQSPVDSSVAKASMIVNSMFESKSFRKGIDISCFLRIPASDVDEWKRLTPLLPHNRKILVSFESGKNGITENMKNDFKNLQQSMFDSKDEGKFVLDCQESVPTTESMFLCGTKQERSKLLKNSIFVLIFPNIPSFQQRLYETIENGGIPVILSMTTSLPFDDFIDWNQAVLRIPQSRSINIADQLELRRKGRFLMENYFLNSKKLIQTILSIFRHRLQLSTTFSNQIQAEPLFNNSFLSNESIPITHPLIMTENLGPVESPTSSEVFLHNFTIFGLYSNKIWNNYPYLIQNTPEFFMDDSIMPSESEFFEETNSGMRPISPGSGQAFSEALGGNRPNEQFTIVIVTYNRDNVLFMQLESFQQLPFLNKIVIIWNNIDREPPKSWPKLHVPIYFVKAKRNSLNNRFLPLYIIETEAVLSLDDDMDLKQAEIILAFRDFLGWEFIMFGAQTVMFFDRFCSVSEHTQHYL